MLTGRYTRFVSSLASVIALNVGVASIGLSQTASDDAITPEADKTTEEMVIDGLASVGLSQATSAGAITSEADKTPEEIVVYGKTNIINLRNKLDLAQESFFDMYNSLNSDDDFDVECKKRQTSISQRGKQHRCMPVFALKFSAQASSGFHNAMGNSFGGVASSGAANLEYEARVKAKEKEMWAEVIELARSNLRFREEIRRLMEAGRELEDEKKRRGPCPKIFCRD